MKDEHITKSLDFIRENVLPKLGIVDFISDNFEIPLAQAKENGDVFC